MKDLLPKIDSPDGEFHNGDPASGTQGTRVTAEWLNDVQGHLRDYGQELKYLLSQAGLSPIPSRTKQVYEAIVAVINANRRNGSTTAKGEIQLTDSINMASSVFGASAQVVKTAYDKANTAHTAANNAQSTANSAQSKANSAYTLAQTKQSPATTLAGYGIADFKVLANLGTQDLNIVTTVGIYGQASDSLATSARHYPEARAGALTVKPSAYGVMQEYVTQDKQIYYARNQRSGGWGEWVRVGGDSLPVGAVLAFPSAVQNPQGFLLCDGSTFEQDTYPDLYRTLGNSNKLPDLTKSDVGMLAYFPFDQIPAGWLPCNGDGITKADHPELFERLKEKYGTYQSGNTEYARLPNPEDRFIRNADNGLTVGQKQEDAIRNITGTFTSYRRTDRKYLPLPSGAFSQVKTLNGCMGNGGSDDWAAEIKLDVSKADGVNVADENRPKSIAFRLCIKVKSNFDQIRFFIKAYGAVTNIGNLNAGNLSNEIQSLKRKLSNLELSFVKKVEYRKTKKKILRISNGIQGETIWRGKTSDPVVCKTKNQGGVIYVLFNIKSKEVITKGHGFHSITRKETITKGYGIHEDRWLSFPLLYADGTVIGDTDTGGTDGDYNYNTVMGIRTKNVVTEYGVRTGETEITITPLIDKDIGSWKDSWRDRTAVIKEVIALGGEEFNQEHPTESESTIDDF